MTNGDRFKKEIAKKSNAGLAEFLVNMSISNACKHCIYIEKTCSNKCEYGIKAWLDTPCEENPPADEPQQEAHDNVNHPAHYTFGNIEVIDFIEDKKLGFHLGNAVKYISRAGRKDPARTVEDLRKAAWYLNRQIERLEGSLGGQNG